MSLGRVSMMIDTLVSGLGSISDFISCAERRIYNPDEIDAMDSETLACLYNAASKRQLGVLELCRKMMKDSKDTDRYSEEVMAMAGFLGNLSTDNLDQLKVFMKERIAN